LERVMNIILTNAMTLFLWVIIGGLLEYRYKRFHNNEAEKATRESIELKKEIKKYVEKLDVLQ